jgi:hypothetical protein
VAVCDQGSPGVLSELGQPSLQMAGGRRKIAPFHEERHQRLLLGAGSHRHEIALTEDNAANARRVFQGECAGETASDRPCNGLQHGARS